MENSILDSPGLGAYFQGARFADEMQRSALDNFIRQKQLEMQMQRHPLEMSGLDLGNQMTEAKLGELRSKVSAEENERRMKAMDDFVQRFRQIGDVDVAAELSGVPPKFVTVFKNLPPEQQTQLLDKWEEQSSKMREMKLTSGEQRKTQESVQRLIAEREEQKSKEATKRAIEVALIRAQQQKELMMMRLKMAQEKNEIPKTLEAYLSKLFTQAEQLKPQPTDDPKIVEEKLRLTEEIYNEINTVIQTARQTRTPIPVPGSPNLGEISKFPVNPEPPPIRPPQQDRPKQQEAFTAGETVTFKGKPHTIIGVVDGGKTLILKDEAGNTVRVTRK